MESCCRNDKSGNGCKSENIIGYNGIMDAEGREIISYRGVAVGEMLSTTYPQSYPHWLYLQIQ